MKVTLVQANQIWENKKANYANFDLLLCGVESDLIVLPEMFNTGFSMNADILAENWIDSTAIDWLKQKAKNLDAAIYTSLIIKDQNSYYNRGVFVEPSGSITHYNKRKLFGLAKEDETFTPGTTREIVHYKGWKFLLQICYDLRFPEIARNSMNNNTFDYDAILYVANWPEKRSSHWNALLSARAIENQAYVIGVNRVGKDKSGLTYDGCSKMIDPLGNEHPCSVNEEQIKMVVLNSTELNKIRELMPFLKDV